MFARNSNTQDELVRYLSSLPPKKLAKLIKELENEIGVSCVESFLSKLSKADIYSRYTIKESYPSNDSYIYYDTSANTKLIDNNTDFYTNLFHTNHQNKSFDPDVLAVEAFMANTEAMTRQFVKLEKDFIDYARQFFTDKNRIFTPSKPHHKLFTSFCQHWAVQNGFSQFFKMKNGLSAIEFAYVLMSLQLFDDLAFRGREHGAIGHFMQWAAIVYYYQETRFLTRTPTEFYQWIGNSEINAAPGQSIWFRLFEISTNSDIFTLNNYLMSEHFSALCPLLSGMLRSREAKGPYARHL